MRPITRTFVACAVAIGTLGLFSPPHVLAAVNDNVYSTINGHQTGTSATAPASGDGGSSLFGSLVELVVALAIIIALIYLLIRFLSTRTNMRGGQAFQTLAAHSLTQNRSVHVLAVGDKVYLLGVGDNVTLLDTITDPEVIEQLQSTQPTNVLGAGGLQELLGRFRPKARTQAEDIQIQDLPFDSALREKLNALKKREEQPVDDWREGKER